MVRTRSKLALQGSTHFLPPTTEFRARRRPRHNYLINPIPKSERSSRSNPAGLIDGMPDDAVMDVDLLDSDPEPEPDPGLDFPRAYESGAQRAEAAFRAQMELERREEARVNGGTVSEEEGRGDLVRMSDEDEWEGHGGYEEHDELASDHERDQVIDLDPEVEVEVEGSGYGSGTVEKVKKARSRGRRHRAQRAQAESDIGTGFGTGSRTSSARNAKEIYRPHPPYPPVPLPSSSFQAKANESDYQDLYKIAAARLPHSASTTGSVPWSPSRAGGTVDLPIELDEGSRGLRSEDKYGGGGENWVFGRSDTATGANASGSGSRSEGEEVMLYQPANTTNVWTGADSSKHEYEPQDQGEDEIKRRSGEEVRSSVPVRGRMTGVLDANFGEDENDNDAAYRPGGPSSRSGHFSGGSGLSGANLEGLRGNDYGSFPVTNESSQSGRIGTRFETAKVRAQIFKTEDSGDASERQGRASRKNLKAKELARRLKQSTDESANDIELQRFGRYPPRIVRDGRAHSGTVEKTLPPLSIESERRTRFGGANEQSAGNGEIRGPWDDAWRDDFEPSKSAAWQGARENDLMGSSRAEGSFIHGSMHGQAIPRGSMNLTSRPTRGGQLDVTENRRDSSAEFAPQRAAGGDQKGKGKVLTEKTTDLAYAANAIAGPGPSTSRRIPDMDAGRSSICQPFDADEEIAAGQAHQMEVEIANPLDVRRSLELDGDSDEEIYYSAGEYGEPDMFESTRENHGVEPDTSGPMPSRSSKRRRPTDGYDQVGPLSRLTLEEPAAKFARIGKSSITSRTGKSSGWLSETSRLSRMRYNHTLAPGEALEKAAWKAKNAERLRRIKERAESKAEREHQRDNVVREAFSFDPDLLRRSVMTVVPKGQDLGNNSRKAERLRLIRLAEESQVGTFGTTPSPSASVAGTTDDVPRSAAAVLESISLWPEQPVARKSRPLKKVARLAKWQDTHESRRIPPSAAALTDSNEIPIGSTSGSNRVWGQRMESKDVDSRHERFGERNLDRPGNGDSSSGRRSADWLAAPRKSRLDQERLPHIAEDGLAHGHMKEKYQLRSGDKGKAIDQLGAFNSAERYTSDSRIIDEMIPTRPTLSGSGSPQIQPLAGKRQRRVNTGSPPFLALGAPNNTDAPLRPHFNETSERVPATHAEWDPGQWPHLGQGHLTHPFRLLPPSTKFDRPYLEDLIRCRSIPERLKPAGAYMEHCMMEPCVYVSDPSDSTARKLLVTDLNGALVVRAKYKESGKIRRAYTRPFLSCLMSYLFPARRDKCGPDPWQAFVWSSAQPNNVAAMIETAYGKHADSVSLHGDISYTAFHNWTDLAVVDRPSRVLGVWTRDNLELSDADYGRKAQTSKDLSKVIDLFKGISKGDQCEGPGTMIHQPFPPFDITFNNILLLDDSADKATKQPYNHLPVPDYTQEVRDRTCFVLSQSRVTRDPGQRTFDGSSVDDHEAVIERASILQAAFGDARTFYEACVVRGQPFEPGIDIAMIGTVGIMSELEDVKNAPAWIAAGGLAPDMSHTFTVDIANRGWEALMKFDLSAGPTRGAPAHPSLVAKAAKHSAQRKFPTDPGHAFWYSDPVVYLYWIRRGMAQLERMKVPLLPGVSVAEWWQEQGERGGQ